MIATKSSPERGSLGVHLNGLWAFAWLVLLATLVACFGGSEVGPRPNVLVISVDTLRRDHLGCYGYERETSPHIDALARRGVVFDNALSTSSWTLPSHASMLTGRYPSSHGLRDDGVELAPSVPTLAADFRRHGYHTLAVVSHVYVSSAFGLDQGFDAFDDTLTEGGATNPLAEGVVDRFLALLAASPVRPFFGFVHFFDPHWPYTAPEPFARRFADPAYTGPIDGSVESLLPYFFASRAMPDRHREEMVARYDGEIAYLDHQLGRLMDGLRERGDLDRTLVVLVADHGEEFKEHGQLGHGRTLYGEQLRVPFVMAGHPALRPGSRRDDLVSLIDLAPTLLDLVGAELPAGVDGRSLFTRERRDRAVFSESIRFGVEMRAVQRGRYKLIHVPSERRELYYDLRDDPGELSPLGRDPTGGKLASMLAEHAASAESGWHLKLIGLGAAGLRCRASIRTSGRFVDPRRYFSKDIGGRRVLFHEFDTGRAASGSLGFDVSISNHVAEVSFETDPPDAAVSFEIHAESAAKPAGVYLASGEEIPRDGPVRLERTDPRLAGLPPAHASALVGVYLRAVAGPELSASRAQLSREAIEHLEALGYVDVEADVRSE
jgi:arylsulfatase A-like enzyme